MVMNGESDFGDSTPVPVDPVDEESAEIPLPDEHIGTDAAETVNLVGTLTDDEQKKLGNEVWDDWDRDWRAGEKHRQAYVEIIRLYTGMLPQKEEGYAQIHYGIILKAIQRLHARIYDQQLPSNGEFFGVKPMDATDVERAIRVAKHLNWQILTQVPNYTENIDRLILQWFLYGSAFTYVYWDPISNKPCHEVCATEDIVLPYARTSTDPSLADMPHITRVVRKYRFGVEGMDALTKSGYYDPVNVKKIFASTSETFESSQDTDSGKIQETIDKVAGMEKPAEDDDKGGPRVLLEQHRWWQLPGSDDFRPVIATIDRDTKILIGLRLRESEDQQDQARYNREKAANDAAHAAAMEQFQAETAIYQANVAAYPQPEITAPPIPGEVTATPAPLPGATDSTLPGAAPPLPAPVEPVPPPPPAPPRMVPINSFTHYYCLPNPEGVYGFGMGHLLAGNNIAADAIASIMVTAGKLSNTATGIRSRMSKISGGEFKIKPGEFPEVDVPPEQLDKVLFQLKFPGPEPQLAQFIRDMMQDAEEVSGAGDILSGEVGGSNETATTTQIRISQALQAISIQNKRFTRARTSEAQKFARLNSIYLGDNEYFSIVSPYKTAPPEMINIARIDYLQDSDIVVTADPRMASQPQRVQEATTALQSILSGPLAQLPQFFPLVIAAYKNLYIAMDRPDLVAALEAAAAVPMMPAPGMPGSAPGPQPGAPEDSGGGGPPQPEPIPPPVPNAGPTPQNGTLAA